ncbi:MAG: hypothetical protein K8T25_23370, partial [Planctomycetia bacterium]|nr:hypothetical protein [Planctomycetia bacterium]
DPFDPYHEWLGIPPAEQPPHRYRLLGLAIFESDPTLIRDEADRRMQHVRTFQLGKRSQASQTVLNELAAAKVCLLNPASKAHYDAALREWLAARLPVPPPNPPPDAPPMLPPESWPAESLKALEAEAHATGSTTVRPSIIPRRFPSGWIVVALMAAATIVGIVLLLRGRSVGDPAPQSGPPAIALPKSEQTEGAGLGGKTVVLPQNVVLQSESGDVNLYLPRAKLTGADLKIQSDATEGFNSAVDQVEWEFLLHRPGIFSVEVTYATDPTSVGGRARIDLSGRAEPLLLPIHDTGGRDTFLTEPVTPKVMIQRGGRYTLRISAAEKRGSELFRLRSVQLRGVQLAR